jgi:hypothetical protein
MMPPMASLSRVKPATQGVGHNPNCHTSNPVEVNPAARAFANVSLEFRES